MDSKFVVLLSGGLDSVVNLYLAVQGGKVLKALTLDYGQRAAANEVKASRYFCEILKVPHEVIELPWLGKMTNTALVQKKQSMPSLKNLDDMVEATASAKSVWVPNRNGVFLNVAATYAESLGAEFVVPGFNKEEAATFPDNSQEFISACDVSFSFSTLNQVKVKCFTTQMNKIDLIGKAVDLKIDLNHLWSCYQAGSAPCGVCESCQRTTRAVAAQRVKT
jgi:7-cyano-7-deazaguanine synthase